MGRKAIHLKADKRMLERAWVSLNSTVYRLPLPCYLAFWCTKAEGRRQEAEGETSILA